MENNSKFDDDSIDYLTEKYLDEEYDYAVLHMGQFHLPPFQTASEPQQRIISHARLGLGHSWEISWSRSLSA